ncbi:hypothetical protein HRbin36_02874 [bacterium HR36]|nr:hypothetical protein HRbin36_02874 [bacterium HR36]
MLLVMKKIGDSVLVESHGSTECLFPGRTNLRCRSAKAVVRLPAVSLSQTL